MNEAGRWEGVYSSVTMTKVFSLIKRLEKDGLRVQSQLFFVIGEKCGKTVTSEVS